MRVKLQLYLGPWLFQEEEFELAAKSANESFEAAVKRRTYDVNERCAELFLLYARQVAGGVPAWIEVTFQSSLNQAVFELEA